MWFGEQDKGLALRASTLRIVYVLCCEERLLPEGFWGSRAVQDAEVVSMETWIMTVAAVWVRAPATLHSFQVTHAALPNTSDPVTLP